MQLQYHDHIVMFMKLVAQHIKSGARSILTKWSADVILWLNFAQSSGTMEYTDCFYAEGYDPPHDGEVPVMLELWGMRSTPSLPLLSGLLWPGVVVLDRALSMG